MALALEAGLLCSAGALAGTGLRLFWVPLVESKGSVVCLYLPCRLSTLCQLPLGVAWGAECWIIIFAGWVTWVHDSLVGKYGIAFSVS